MVGLQPLEIVMRERLGSACPTPDREVLVEWRLESRRVVFHQQFRFGIGDILYRDAVRRVAMFEAQTKTVVQFALMTYDWITTHRIQTKMFVLGGQVINPDIRPPWPGAFDGEVDVLAARDGKGFFPDKGAPSEQTAEND